MRACEAERNGRAAPRAQQKCTRWPRAWGLAIAICAAGALWFAIIGAVNALLFGG